MRQNINPVIVIFTALSKFLREHSIKNGAPRKWEHRGELNLFQVCFGDIYIIGESSGIVYSEISKDLAVYVYVCFVETVHQTAVGNVVHSGSSVDSGDPEFSEIAFLFAAMCKSVSAGTKGLLFGNSV